MSEKKTSEYKIAIFSAMISIVLTAIYDLAKDKPVLSTLWGILKWIWLNIFEFKIKLWYILIIVITIYLILRIFKNSLPIKALEADHWLNYKEDEIGKKKWRWNWKKDPLTNKWSVEDLVPVCFNCETSMHLHVNGYRDSAECPRCDNRIEQFKDLSKVESVIVDNVKRDLY